MKGGKSKADTKRSDSRLAVKNQAAKPRAPPARKAKAAKDPHKPKRPPSAFFVFMEEFRKEYKAKHPNNKSVSAVGKAAGERWKQMSESDKAPFVARAEKRKAEYEKSMNAYNKKQAEGAGAEEEESDKSKSEVHDDDDDEDDEGSDEEDEDDD